MGKMLSKKHQKMYKMKGCSKKSCKNYLGGNSSLELAYTGKPIVYEPNPFLAYTGKGGENNNPIYPNPGPVPTEQIFFNSSNPQHGGNCGCGLPKLFGGKRKSSKMTRKYRGGCGPLCAAGLMVAGSKHRLGCKCSNCKNRLMKGGNQGIPYPNGLVGSPWTTNSSTWPGVNGVPGDSNYYTNNTYNNDISRQMVDVGANPPFLKGGKSKSRKQKGGSLSNFIGQDLINLGRQLQYGVGSAYNALAGYSSPVNPLPWKDQMINKFN